MSMTFRQWKVSAHFFLHLQRQLRQSPPVALQGQLRGEDQRPAPRDRQTKRHRAQLQSRSE